MRCKSNDLNHNLAIYLFFTNIDYTIVKLEDSRDISSIHDLEPTYPKVAFTLSSQIKDFVCLDEKPTKVPPLIID